MFLLHPLSQEEFGHVYSTVNKKNKEPSQPNQEIGKNQSSEEVTVSASGMNDPPSDVISTAHDDL